MKISAKNKDCRLCVKVKTVSREVVDQKELDRFARVYMRCFLKPKLEKKNQLEYSGPVGVPLQDRMKKPMTKRDFLFILGHIVVAVQKLQHNKFPLYHLNMTMQQIYINETTKELQFLYVPLKEACPNGNLLQLLNAIIYASKPAAEADTDYVSRFHYFLQSMKPFDINKVEQFVQQEDRTVMPIIKKHNAGQSGYMTNNPQNYYNHIAAQQNTSDDTALLDDATGLLPENMPVYTPPAAPVIAVADEDATGLLQEEPEDIPIPPVIAPAAPVVAVADEDATGLLQEEPEEIPAPPVVTPAAPVYEPKEAPARPVYTPPAPVYVPEEDATGLLQEEPEDEDGTTLLVEEAPVAQTVVYPELRRVLTGELIPIRKPVFRLGKERSYVDYFVNNNNAVSRSHADIITRGSSYFVIDLNSKNRTYINNVPLMVQVETEIHDGDLLRLGNEEFVFHLSASASATPVCPKCRAQVKPSAKFCTSCGHKL